MLIDLRSYQGPDGWENPADLPVPIVTCAEMKRLEQAADEAGLSYLEMMENAGTDAARLICQLACGDLEERAGESAAGLADSRAVGPQAAQADGLEACLPRVLILCGKGNNGGDGHVAARHLFLAGFPLFVLPAEGPPATPDAIANYDRLPAGVRILTEASLESFLAEPAAAPVSSDSLARLAPTSPGALDLVIVDALFGTGFRGRLDEGAQRLIQRLNGHAAFHRRQTAVICLDLPSGLPGDLAEGVPGPSLQGDYTLAFHGLKPIHLNPEALPRMGGLMVADIGIGHALAGI